MPAPDKIQADAPPHKGRTHAAAVLIYAVCLTGLLHLICLQAANDAPLRGQRATNQLAGIEAQLQAVDADPRNAQMLAVLPEPPTPPIARQLTMTYFAAQYLRYPRRLFVGGDDQIINDKEQFLSAATSIPPGWMKQHQVGLVYVVYGAGPGPQLEVREAR